MRQKGSILVVVLGLLSILAVIGVAFLTLSSLERSTATSFALQTQMMIAADGALDYAVHQMVTDVWEWDVKLDENDKPVFSFTGNLLTGRPASTPGVFPYSAACETFDYPSDADPWLSSPITGNTTPDHISFAGPVVQRFGIKFGGTTATVDNLGIPVDDPAKNGIWIPDLAAPYDQYLVRASLTILDHNALINFNAHGSRDTGEDGWEYGDCIGKGYFVSDVLPGQPLSALLTGELGCWGDDDQPGNPKTGALLIENPYAGQDIPFTLDEEFELRNLAGTLFQSRLEQIWSIPTYTQRLKTTTVSWTADVRGDGYPPDLPDSEKLHKTTGGWSAAKVDLNTASADDIYHALLDGRAWDDDDDSKAKLKQFVANILTFRRIEIPSPQRPIKIMPIPIDGTNYIGAVRQPVFSEATRTGPVLDETDPDDIKRTYTIKVEVYNPWPGDYSGHTGELLTNMQVTFDVNAPHEVLINNNQKLDKTTAGDTCCSPIVERQVVCHNDLTLRDVLQSIRLHWGTVWLGKVLNLDLIDNTQVADLENTGRIYRKVDFKDEYRSSKTTDNAPIRVFYVSDWNSGGPPNLGSATKDINLRNTAIPIRFPNCVSEDQADALPVRAAGGPNNPFKAFARVGDLDQVLRFSPGQDTWWSEPWICTVSQTPRSQESTVKFDWMKDIDNVVAGTGTAAAYAANVLSVGGPWNDGIDNDGDKQTDLDDTGQPGGPELRVAGKINLNTALPETLTALTSGVGLGSITTNRPLKSPAQILGINSATPGGIEARDLPFTRISNIATVRSDTFSVYGTVQIVAPSSAQKGDGVIQEGDILRTRRFWALVDRSPSLAYPPGGANFIPPRILNFQWLD